MATYSDEDKQLAASIVSNKDIVELLGRIFLTEDTKLSAEVISTKPNAELGEFVRADYLAEQKVLNRFSKLKQLASEVKTGKKGGKVPR